MFRMPRTLALVAGLLVVSALAGCGTSGGASNGDDDVVVPDTTKVVGDHTEDALTGLDADGTLRFASETALLASLANGDVIVAGIVPGAAPDGFLRTVTDVRRDGDAVVVETDPATLTDAIDRADASFRRRLTGDDVAGTQDHVPGVTLETDGAGKAFGLDLSETLISVEGAEVRVDGDVDVDAELILELEIDKSKPLKPKTWVKRFEASAALAEEVDLTLHAEGTLEKSVEKELKTINIASIEFFIGPVPVVIAADLTFFLQFDGTLAAAVTTRVSQSASLKVGGRYLRSGGWSGIHETSSSFDHDVPSFDASARARVAAGSRVAVGLYGEQGAAGTMTGRAFLDAEASTSGFPLWCLYGGLNASYGYQVSVPVIDVDLVDYEKTFAEFRGEIACADNHDPTVSVTSPADGAELPEASQIVFQAEADDAEGDPTLSWSVAGRDLSGSGASFPVDDLCPGDHTVTVTARDGQGATAAAQVTVTVTNRPPEVTITEAPGSVGQFNDFRLRGTATDPTCDDPDGRRVDLDRLTWDLDGGFGGTGSGIVTQFSQTGDDRTVTLGYTDAAGAHAETTTDIDVGANDPTESGIVVINEPQEGARFELRSDTEPCHRVDVAAQASSSVADGDLQWSYDDGSGFTEFGAGRTATLELACHEVVYGGGYLDVDLRVAIAGESGSDASDAIALELRTLGQ